MNAMDDNTNLADPHAALVSTDTGAPHAIWGKVRKGGIHAVTPERLAQIDSDIVASLSGPYLEQASADLQLMESAHADIRPGESIDSASVQRLRRVLHETRGMGGTFGYLMITEIANHIHGLIHAEERTTEEQLGGIKVHLDAIGLVISEQLSGDGGERGNEVMNGLQKVYLKLVKKSS